MVITLGNRNRVCLWRIAGRLLERADDRKTLFHLRVIDKLDFATDRTGVGAESMRVFDALPLPILVGEFPHLAIR